MKVLIYILYIAGDTESQRKGLVVLTWPSHQSVFPDFSFGDSEKELARRLLESASIRLCAMHACIPDTYQFRMLRPLIVRAFCPSDRPRLKFFVGTFDGWRRDLPLYVWLQVSLYNFLDAKATAMSRQCVFNGYGIPTENIPITDTGNVKMSFLRQWIKLRTLCEGKDETDTANEDIVEFPGSSDVLYRTGTTTLCHPGNSAFRDLIESKMAEVQISSSFSFPMLADELVKETLQIRQGRFLRWDNNGYWTVLNDRAQINGKVTASIRDFNRRKSDTDNMQTLESSTHIFEDQQDQKRRKKSSDDTDF